jgi:LEA14-like dessication related protein
MPHPTRRAGIGALAVASLTLSCAVVQRLSFSEPTVRLAAIHIQSLDLGGGMLNLLLDIHNPNPYRIRGTQLSADVALEDTPFGAVSRDAPWLLPADADTTLALRLEFGWAAVGSAARALLDRGAVRYTMTGRVLVGTTADERWVTINLRGDVPLERLKP